MNKDFEVMGLMIYFGFIHLVEGGYQDLKAFEKDKSLKDLFVKFNDIEIYKSVQIPKLSSRSFLALRGCYRKKKLDIDEVYKKLKLVANKIGTEHLEYCINSTISLYYPDKKVPQNAFKEIVYINERLGINVDFTYKHLALEDLSKIDEIKVQAKQKQKVDIVKEDEDIVTNSSSKNIVIFAVAAIVLLAIVYFVLM
jgi:hypothetical protein